MGVSAPCLLFLALLTVSAWAISTTVEMSNGQVVGKLGEGSSNTDLIVFQGIPFAQPPVADLRWRSPQPYTAKWTSPWDATYFRSACPQHGPTFAPMSEDCLYLNVYVPTKPKSDASKLPVLLWFYGGSWEFGTASIPLYEPQQQVSRLQNAIWVTINYRLGALGFLGSDVLRTVNQDGSTGNFGFQDQREAMKWVQQNIGFFGGNPDNVMIFGQSAGAGSTSGHLVSARSKGLFAKAVVESGPWAKWNNVPWTYATCVWDNFLKSTDCDSTPNDANSTIACIHQVPSKTIVDLQERVTKTCHPQLGSSSFGIVDWAPMQDGVEFDNSTIALAEAGHINVVPIMVGSVAQEATVFLTGTGISFSATKAEFATWQAKWFPQSAQSTLASLYPLSDYPATATTSSAARAAIRIMSDAMMTCPARRMARIMSAQPNASARLYWSQYVPELIQIADPKIGAFHGSEIPMVFFDQEVLIGKGEAALSEQFGGYWTAFAGTSDPNTPIAGGFAPSVEWPSYNATADINLNFRTTQAIQAGSRLKSSQCNFWDELFIA